MGQAFIGVDPDLHDTGIAIATIDEVLWVGHAHVKTSLKGHDAVRAMINEIMALDSRRAQRKLPCWVESQRVYSRHQKANPNNLIHLAQVAGGAAAILDGKLIYPQDWKGQVEKHVDQSRTYTHYGWKSTLVDKSKSKKDWYRVPINQGFDIKGSAWKHVGDALSICLWAAKEHEKRERRDAAKLR